MGFVLGRSKALASSALTGALVSWALAACSGSAGGGTPQQVAERVTRAVYANDLNTTIGAFDDTMQRNVTRAQLGDLSDRMHELGAFTSIVQRSGTADTGRYEFDASFTGGMMLVQMRIDPGGKIGAYRVTPEAISAPPTRSSQG